MKFDFEKFISIASRDVGYNPAAKEQFLKMARQLAKMTADALGLATGDRDIRVNKAGIAVSGEVTLHSDSLYVQFGQGMMGNTFLCRSCKGRKDYTGGMNNFYRWEDLRDFGRFVDFLKRLS
ncbi:hypothetical protein EBZ39_13935 [bacterium]|nr:hypothetical protein [bacterium]